MSQPLRFLIVDGYPKPSRDQFDEAGMTLSYKLYSNMLHRYLPDAETEVWLPSDTADLPGGDGPDAYAGVLWTGCNLTVYHDEDRVLRQIDLSKRAYAVGTPQFGSCWGLQMAVFAAGGEVKPNPKGREMGLARKIRLTDEGREHPMMAGKPQVYDAFISHDDHVTQLPPGATWLASNDWSRIQAVAVQHGKGTFWGLQYHPEYDLAEVAALITTREPKLVGENFFQGHDDLMAHVERLQALAAEPDRKDLRWSLDIDDDVLDADRRQVEFANWITQVVKPAAAR